LVRCDAGGLKQGSGHVVTDDGGEAFDREGQEVRGRTPALPDKGGKCIARESGHTKAGERQPLSGNAVDKALAEKGEPVGRLVATTQRTGGGRGGEDHAGEGGGGGCQAPGVKVVFGFERIGVDAATPVDERGGSAVIGGFPASGPAVQGEKVNGIRGDVVDPALREGKRRASPRKGQGRERGPGFGRGRQPHQQSHLLERSERFDIGD
jgi:hypothetical protein